MDVLGIITEYNPFHNGHLYHLQKAKKITGTKYTVCAMNGNFMQRGKPAMIDKWQRTEMALNCGVDLVIEIPLVYGIRSAEYFADGSVRLLDETGTVEALVFGSEAGNLKLLETIAGVFVDEPRYYRTNLKKYINQGCSYPRAREKALLNYFKYTGRLENSPGAIIKSPNNILAIEYLKALKIIDSSIKSFTVKRRQTGYHDREIEGQIASATAIRNKLDSDAGNIEGIKKVVPAITREIIIAALRSNKIPIRREHLETLIFSTLRRKTPEELADYPGLKGGLNRRIKEYSGKTGSLKDLIDGIKTRAFTWTRIERSLLQILFDLTEEKLKEITAEGPQYFRILGFTGKGQELLSRIKKRASLPLITQPANYLNDINTESKNLLQAQLSYDLLATDIYTLLYKNKNARKGKMDFYHPLIKVDTS